MSLSFRGCAIIFSCEGHRSPSLWDPLTGVAIALLQKLPGGGRTSNIKFSQSSFATCWFSELLKTDIIFWAFPSERLGKHEAILLQNHSVELLRPFWTRMSACYPVRNENYPGSLWSLTQQTESPAAPSQLTFSWLWLFSPKPPWRQSLCSSNCFESTASSMAIHRVISAKWLNKCIAELSVIFSIFQVMKMKVREVKHLNPWLHSKLAMKVRLETPNPMP